MSELKIKDGDSVDKFIGAIGTGATGDPYNTIPADFLIETSRENINKYSTLSKFGVNPDIVIASGFETIWDAGATYVPPTTARLHDVASDNAADAGTTVTSGTATGGSLTTLIDTGATFISVSVAVGDMVLNDDAMEIGFVTAVTSETELAILGSMRNPNTGINGVGNASTDNYRVVRDASTGASVLYILGLNISLAETNEFVVLNGTSNVVTASSYKRQFRARAFATASTGVVGTVTSTAQTDGTVTCQVINGNNQTLMSVYTIPFGKTGYIMSWWGSLTKKQAASSVVVLRAGVLDGMGYVIQVRALNSTGDSGFNYEYKAPRPIAGGADIWVEADTDTNNIGIASGFEILLVDD